MFDKTSSMDRVSTPVVTAKENLFSSASMKLLLHQVEMTKKIGIGLSLTFVVVFPVLFDMLARTCLPLPDYIKHAKLLNQNTQVADIRSPYIKTFAYYTTTDQCLPDHFMESTIVGNGDDRDVYVVSLKKKCKKDKIPSHVTYIYDPKSTWSTGRNRIFQYVKRREYRYMYHIFFDDDIELQLTTHLAKQMKRKRMSPDAVIDSVMDTVHHSRQVKKVTNSTPWRLFEQSVVMYHPAVAVANFRHLENREEQEKRWSDVCRHKTKMPSVTPTFCIDTSLVSIHEEALLLLMPLPTILHHWYSTAAYFVYPAKSILYRQCIAVWDVSVTNTKTKPSPGVKDLYGLRHYWKTDQAKVILPLFEEKDRVLPLFSSTSNEWRDFLFADKGVCTAPIRFPVNRFYAVTPTA